MNEPIQHALQRLRQEAAGTGAPGDLESRLLTAYRKRHAAARRRKWMWVSGSLAACLTIALGVRMLLTATPERPAMPRIAVAPPPPLLVNQPILSRARQQAEVANAKPPAHTRRSAMRPEKRPPQNDFIRIPYAPAFTHYDGGSVVRVNMPGASVRSLGIPVISDRIEADLMLGDDGVARAIRVVSSSGLDSTR